MTVSQSLKRRRTFSQFLDISTTPILITHTHLQWHDFHRTFYQQTAGYPRSKKPESKERIPCPLAQAPECDTGTIASHVYGDTLCHAHAQCISSLFLPLSPAAI